MHHQWQQKLIYSPKYLDVKSVSKECIFLKSTAMANSAWGDGPEIIFQAPIWNLHHAPNSIAN